MKEENPPIEQCPHCSNIALLSDYQVYTTTHDATDYLKCRKCGKMFKPIVLTPEEEKMTKEAFEAFARVYPEEAYRLDPEQFYEVKRSEGCNLTNEEIDQFMSENRSFILE